MNQPDVRHKSLAFEVKAADDDGSVTLYCAVFGNVDLQGDVLMPGAFANLNAFVKEGWGAVNHANWGPDLGVAWVESAEQDAIGLKVVAKFHSTPDAQAVRTKIRERMAAGKSVQCSFGFNVLDAAPELRGGKTITLLKSVDIFEFSFVNKAANPMAGVASAKSEGLGLMGIDDAQSLIEAVKAGRAVSRANHGKLSNWCGQLDEQGKAAIRMAAELKAFLDEHDPDKGGEGEAQPPSIAETQDDAKGGDAVTSKVDSGALAPGADPQPDAKQSQALADARAYLTLAPYDPVIVRASRWQ
jgi:HK97 family phage prohead protease